MNLHAPSSINIQLVAHSTSTNTVVAHFTSTNTVVTHFTCSIQCNNLQHDKNIHSYSQLFFSLLTKNV